MTDDAKLSAVSETLFLPLYALALESQTPNPIMVDRKSVELTRRLNEHFAGSDKRIYRRLAEGRLPGTLLATMALRVRRYDRYVAEFLERVPDGIVVSLGCGLDGRPYRVDNGSMRWYGLDLPEVIAFRRQFLPEQDRVRYIAKSVLDFDWFDDLPSEPGANYLFVAEGLLMYLPADAVRSLVTKLAETYPGAELIAEVANSTIVRSMQSRWGRGKFKRQFGLSENVVYGFGLDDSRDMEKWAPGLTFLEDWTYFDEDEPKLSWMRWFGGIRLFRWAQWTVRYRFEVEA